MGEFWAKAKPWAVGVTCGWVLLAFVFLMASVDHPLFSAETATKIYKTLSDIVLLKWVTKYQTLLAGLAALSGGIAVIWTAIYQVKESNKKSVESELQQIKENIITAQHITALSAIAKDNYDIRPFVFEKTVYNSIIRCNSNLGVFYHIFMLNISNNNADLSMKRINAEGYTLALLFSTLSSSLKNIQLSELPLKASDWFIQTENLEAIANKFGVNTQDLMAYKDYFSHSPATPPAA